MTQATEAQQAEMGNAGGLAETAVSALQHGALEHGVRSPPATPARLAASGPRPSDEASRAEAWRAEMGTAGGMAGTAVPASQHGTYGYGVPRPSAPPSRPPRPGRTWGRGETCIHKERPAGSARAGGLAGTAVPASQHGACRHAVRSPPPATPSPLDPSRRVARLRSLPSSLGVTGSSRPT